MLICCRKCLEAYKFPNVGNHPDHYRGSLEPHNSHPRHVGSGHHPYQHHHTLHTLANRKLTSEEQKQAQAIVEQMKHDIIDRFKLRQARKAASSSNAPPTAAKLLHASSSGKQHFRSSSPQRKGPFSLSHTLGPRVHTSSKRNRQRLEITGDDVRDDSHSGLTDLLPDEPEDDDV